MKLPLLLPLSLAQHALHVALPHGGHGVARRNAWAGMSENAARLRAHREADAAVRAAELRQRPATGAR